MSCTPPLHFPQCFYTWYDSHVIVFGSSLYRFTYQDAYFYMKDRSNTYLLHGEFSLLHIYKPNTYLKLTVFEHFPHTQTDHPWPKKIDSPFRYSGCPLAKINNHQLSKKHLWWWTPTSSILLLQLVGKPLFFFGTRMRFNSLTCCGPRGWCSLTHQHVWWLWWLTHQIWGTNPHATVNQSL